MNILRQFIREAVFPIYWAPAQKLINRWKRGEEIDPDELQKTKNWWATQYPDSFLEPERTELYLRIEKDLQDMYDDLHPRKEYTPDEMRKLNIRMAYSDKDVTNAERAIRVWKTTGQLPTPAALNRMSLHIRHFSDLDPDTQKQMRRDISKMQDQQDYEMLGIDPDE